MTVKAGTIFLHHRVLDPDWKPGPGQGYRDAPGALMRVTRVTETTVFYRYANDTKPGARFSMSRATWDAWYGKGSG